MKSLNYLQTSSWISYEQLEFHSMMELFNAEIINRVLAREMIIMAPETTIRTMAILYPLKNLYVKADFEASEAYPFGFVLGDRLLGDKKLDTLFIRGLYSLTEAGLINFWWFHDMVAQSDIYAIKQEYHDETKLVEAAKVKAMTLNDLNRVFLTLALGLSASALSCKCSLLTKFATTLFYAFKDRFERIFQLRTKLRKDDQEKPTHMEAWRERVLITSRQ